MEKIKTIVDREPVSSDYIETKQDFGHVLSQVKNLKPPIWKTAWFYGPVGMAVVAAVVSTITINPANEQVPELADVEVHEKLTVELNQQELHTNVQVASINRSVPAITNTRPEETEKKQVQLSPEPEKPLEEKILEKPIQIQEKIPTSVAPTTVKKMNNLPHIEGHYMGEIPYAVLSSENGIQCNDEIKVVAFNVHYPTGYGTETASVVGNKVPQRVLESIKKNGMGYMVFFTDIKGVTPTGKVVSLTSMNFIATN